MRYLAEKMTHPQQEVAAVQTTESGQPVFMCLSRRPFTKQLIREFAERSLGAPATLVTDGLGCFTAVRGQVQYLFNRRFDLRAILGRLARAACQAQPSPLHVIRAAEVPC